MKPRQSAVVRSMAIVFVSMLAAVVPAQDRVQLERRAQSIGTLIESSSASRQIETSGVQAARERRDNARLMHREAIIALRGGDLGSAAKLLDQSAKEMMAGVRFAKPEQVAGEKNKRDFEARLDSTRALLAAQQRITREKSAGTHAQEATRSIERQIGEAQVLAAQNRYEDARPVLDRAYLTARISIESMRRGDTLIRSLNFASPREEYDYEIDRNETHRMLITVLLADRKDAVGAVPSDIQAFNEKAALLRRDAEMRATRGDYEGAIKLLEDSTRELIRAIRVGGIYIPG
jgi:tetratricopeptide (TPR) repeat protein